MKFITDLIRYFVYITTGILFVFITILLLNGSSGISLQMLIEIPCTSLATALVTVLIISKETIMKREFYIRMAVHYLLLCLTVIFLGTTFGWIEFNISGVITIVISTAMVYAFTFAGTYLSSKSDAKKLNKALQSKREQKNRIREEDKR